MTTNSNILNAYYVNICGRIQGYPVEKERILLIKITKNDRFCRNLPLPGGQCS